MHRNAYFSLFHPYWAILLLANWAEYLRVESSFSRFLAIFYLICRIQLRAVSCVGLFINFIFFLFDRSSNCGRVSWVVIDWWQVGGLRDPPVLWVFVFWVKFFTVGFFM